MSLTPGTGVSAEDLASVREAQQEMMPEVVTILKRTTTRDVGGGTEASWTALPSPTIGRIGSVKDAMRVAFAGQLRGKATSILTVPVGTPVAELDRVHVLGSLHNVVADLSRSSYSTASRYLIEEV